MTVDTASITFAVASTGPLNNTVVAVALQQSLAAALGQPASAVVILTINGVSVQQRRLSVVRRLDQSVTATYNVTYATPAAAAAGKTIVNNLSSDNATTSAFVAVLSSYNVSVTAVHASVVTATAVVMVDAPSGTTMPTVPYV